MNKMADNWVQPTLKSNPIPIKVKYSRDTLVPGELIAGNHIAQKYKLIGGEVVLLQYISVYDNTKCDAERYLDNVCRELFDMDFASVEAAWKRRLGSVSGWWHRIGMELCE